jgi:hypothetical protein
MRRNYFAPLQNVTGVSTGGQADDAATLAGLSVRNHFMGNGGLASESSPAAIS